MAIWRIGCRTLLVERRWTASACARTSCPRVKGGLRRRHCQHRDAVPGFCWWSAFHGDWHVLLLYLDRAALDDLEWGTPEVLAVAHPAVREAAEVLGLDV